jgi:hypothetical protein
MTIFGKSKEVTVQEIINLWNHHKYPLQLFPLIDVEIARARLTAFRSFEEWITIFEFIGFNTEAGLCLNDIHAYGNKIRRSKFRFQERVLDPLSNSENYPFFETDDLGNSLINPFDFEVQIKGKVRKFYLREIDYKQLGIDLHKSKVDTLTKILRYLSYQHPDEIFLTHEEQMLHLHRQITFGQFIQFFDWYHPDYRLGEGLEDSPCLMSLAKALSARDPTLYECPNNMHNTHWSNWDDF